MITTEELEQAIRRGRPQALMAEEYAQPSPASYLRQLLRDRGLNTREAIRRCNLDRSYGYQLFNGTRVPSRCLTILMALELRFTEEETQRLLKLAGRQLCAGPALRLCRRIWPRSDEAAPMAALGAMRRNCGASGLRLCNGQ